MPIPIQKGRLGRGLASLIGETPQAESRLPAHGEQRLLSIDQLHPSGHNPRKTFGDIELIELAESIRHKGLLQPIIARPDRERGGFEIVAGERRWRAAQKASLHTVPVIVRELSDQEAAEFALIENVQRDGPQPDRGSDRLQRADREVQLHPGAGGGGDRQEPQPSRQHPAPAAAAGIGAGLAAGRPADLRARPGADRPRRCGDAGPAHRRGRPQRASRRGARPGREVAQAAAVPSRGGRSARTRMRIPAPSRRTCRTRSASRSRSSRAPARAAP